MAGISHVSRAAFLLIAGAIAIAVALCACGRATVSSRTEPQRIVIRNASGVDLAYVRLAPYAPNSRTAPRYAAVSPVPRGISQAAVRAPNAPPLPRKVSVHYQATGRDEKMVVVDLKEALRQGDSRDRTLVFLIRSDDKVAVFLE